MEVSLCNILITLLKIHVLHSPDKEYTLTLAQMHWFYNKGLVIFLLIKLLPKIIHLLWQDPGLREEIIFVRKYFGHPHKIPAQVILASKLIHPGVMINALMRLQFCQLLRSCACNIAPVYVPVTSLIFHHFVTKLFESLSHHHVSALRCAQIEVHLLFPLVTW